MDKQVITLETLNDKITNIDARNKSYMQNFAFIREQFLKIDQKMKMQDNLADQQENQFTHLEEQIQRIMRVINDEVMYYKDRRETPPNPDMYSGGFKSRKSRRNLVNRRRKTSKRK